MVIDRSKLILRIPHVAGCYDCYHRALKGSDPKVSIVWGHTSRDPNGSDLLRYKGATRHACEKHEPEAQV